MATPSIKRKRDDDDDDDAPSSSAANPEMQLPMHLSSEATSRFTFCASTALSAAGSPSSAGIADGIADGITGGSAGGSADDADGGSSPRTHVASRFGSLVIEEERVHKRMRSEVDTDTSTRDTDTDTDTDRNTARQTTAIDPLRASLTWQDDEITIYDPNDKDDDGTGVNGIGFKPTPAIAHARALKRRQQLIEYRKREEREARARRSRRRPRVYTTRPKAKSAVGTAGAAGAAGTAETVDMQAVESGPAQATPSPVDDDAETPRPRRVRFLETGPVTIRFLEPEVAV